MNQPRKELSDLLRPRLKPPGFNDAAFLGRYDAILDAGGMRRDDGAAAVAVGGLAAALKPKPPGAVAPDGLPAAPLPGIGIHLDPDIAMIDVALLSMVSDTPDSELSAWVGPVKAAAIKFEINSIRRVAAFVAQMAHESGLKPRSENLNYSVAGLLKTFGRHRISAEDAAKYGRKPGQQANQEAIANCIYGGEWGRVNLGNTQPGDGWTFRGGGPLQVTGRANWTRFAQALGMDLGRALTYARALDGGIMAAAWFWETNDINRLADTPGVADETRRINGGQNGIADRTNKFNALVEEMLRREREAAR